MNRGLLNKAVREMWPVTVVFALGLAGVKALLAYVIPTFFMEASESLLQLAWLQTIFRGLFGTEIGSTLGPAAITALTWVHPIVLTIVCAQVVVLCTKVPAGEIDHGTIDVLLGLPVSRAEVYVSSTIVWLGSGLLLLAMGMLGNWLGARLSADEPWADPHLLLPVIVNLYCLYVAVGAMACLASAMSDRRGRAAGAVFGIFLASYILNFVAQLWKPAANVSFLSVFRYYRPAMIRQDSHWPTADMLVLLVTAGVFWLVGAIVFARRDIRTV